jgi:DNA ligase D-like protein (predicted 3'-phosphoesterase)
LKLHRATKDHLDLRLCHHTLALSWAFYLLPSHCPDRECVAVQTEDHLRENILFEGVHPEGQYGAGPMIVLSKGSWRPLPEYMDVAESKWLGCLRFFIECPLMRGAWTLIRNERTAHMKNPHWMLRKEPDEYALSKDPMDILDWTKLPSCLTGQTIEEMEHNWHLGSRHLRASGSLFVFDSTH